jgi:hypothetical protein
MKKTLIYLVLAVLVAACRGGSSGSLQRKDQQNYDVVQEGQATGVTSTINAPGEVPPPPATMTGTNADTTSNFTLPGVTPTTTSTQPPGTLAGHPATTPEPTRPEPATTSTEQKTDAMPRPSTDTQPPPTTT